MQNIGQPIKFEFQIKDKCLVSVCLTQYITGCPLFFIC